MHTTNVIHEVLQQLVNVAYTNSKEKGFWTGPENDNAPTKICLMHSELSEMLEAYRKGNPPCDKVYKENDETRTITILTNTGERRTITSMEEEVADLFIRLADFCGRYDIDLAEVVLAKMKYNATRSYMHGNKKC